jgi:hypothetical protein
MEKFAGSRCDIPSLVPRLHFSGIKGEPVAED